MGKKKGQATKKASKKTKASSAKEESVPDLDQFLNDLQDDDKEDDEDASEEDLEGSESEDEQNKKYMSNLSKKDPEFFKFLQENDQELLANINEDSSDESDDDGEVEKAHKPPEKLEVASDESDFDDEEEEEKAGKKSKKVIKINKALLDKWDEQLQTSPGVALLADITEALKAAIQSLGGDDKDQPVPSRFKVQGGAMFNSIIRICISRMVPAMKKVLKVEGELKPSKLNKSKKWKPLNKTLKAYTMELIRLLTAIKEETVLTVLLKHMHQMTPFYAALPKSSKNLMQRLILLWSTSEESVRILAFLCIVRLVRMSETPMMESAMKNMYMAYVKNCRFTSPSTWPMINFMRRSLVEVFALNPKLAYNHAFVYIRQLGISLRNAITLHKKESIQVVYNWQFVHSIHLWADLLGECATHQAMEGLVMPVVQLADGCIKLISTSKYFPLRFHVCKILTKLSEKTKKFIPVLPYYLEVLNEYQFNKKSSKVSMKPMDFSCILKLSKAQLLENGAKDTILDEIYRGMYLNLRTQAHSIAFPELVVPLVMQVKAFIQTCKVANFCKKMKQLLEKVEENRKFVIAKRKAVAFMVGDTAKVNVWQTELEAKGTPLARFYDNWSQVKRQEEEKIRRDKLDDYDFIPSIKKKEKKLSEPKTMEDFNSIFDDGTDDDSEDDEIRFDPDKDRGGKRKAMTAPEKAKKAKVEEASSPSEESEVDEEDIDDDLADEDDEVLEMNADEFDSSDGENEEESNEEEEDDDTDSD